MNYTLITDKLIVGSQPQKPEDIDHLKREEDVAYILNLQQDRDIEYWEIDLKSIIKKYVIDDPNSILFFISNHFLPSFVECG